MGEVVSCTLFEVQMYNRNSKSIATNKQTIAQSRISASIDGKAKVSVDVTKQFGTKQLYILQKCSKVFGYYNSVTTLACNVMNPVCGIMCY